MNEIIGEITITLESEERKYPYEQLGLTYESSDSDIISALSSMLKEDVGIDLGQEYDDGEWTIKRVDSSQNIYIFPKSTAGRQHLNIVRSKLRGSNTPSSRGGQHPERPLARRVRRELAVITIQS